MKNLILVIMLIAIGVTLPVDASAKIDSATLEKQRKENKARLDKAQELRTGKPKKRLFSTSEVKANKLRSLKLDALPPSPRRAAKISSKNSELTHPGNPGRTTSAAETKHGSEEVATPQE